MGAAFKTLILLQWGSIPRTLFIAHIQAQGSGHKLLLRCSLSRLQAQRIVFNAPFKTNLFIFLNGIILLETVTLENHHGIILGAF